jgi:DNA polymerase-4
MNVREEKTLHDPREIVHLDMDAFYAAVEVLDDPSLAGKPVIVGGSRERGVVTSASYEARPFGIHSAQPVAAAARLCPHGIFLPVRMARYREVSEVIFGIFHRFTPLVEPLSIDEAFLDVTGSRRLFGPSEQIAREIKRLVRQEVGLTVSAGIASTKFVAKIASDLRKPDGLVIVPHEKTQAFLDPLPITRLWGVGQVTFRALKRLGVSTIGDLRRIPVERLRADFGRHGEQLHNLSRGIDPRPVEPDRPVKSIGREETFPSDLTSGEALKRELLSLATRVARRARRHGLAGRTVTLKVKYGDFRLVTRSTTLETPSDDAAEIYRTCCNLLLKTMAGQRPVRLLGIYLSGLASGHPAGQMSLLEVPGDALHRRRRLHRALDALADRFGEDAVVPGMLLDKPNPSPRPKKISPADRQRTLLPRGSGSPRHSTGPSRRRAARTSRSAAPGS